MKPKKILYAIGPGDVVASFKDWRYGKNSLSETSLTFSGLFFDYCKLNNVNCWCISSNDQTEGISVDLFRIENRPKTPPGYVSGLAFHIRQLKYCISLIQTARIYRPDLVVVDSGTTSWFFLILFSFLGFKTVVNLHNVLYPAGYPPKGIKDRFLHALDGIYFKFFCSGALGCSPECERQVKVMAGSNLPFSQYRAQFNPKDFFGIAPPDPEKKLFKIMFAGRIEENKGVFDIVKIAKSLNATHPEKFHFDICGGGDAFVELQTIVAIEKLEHLIKLHGKLNRPDLIDVYSQSHLVIVPTLSTFCEGMPMVSAEAVLSNRPVLTSRLSNALDVLQGAVVEAIPDDPESYVRNIISIYENKDEFMILINSCKLVSGQFINREVGFDASLNLLISGLQVKS